MIRPKAQGLIVTVVGKGSYVAKHTGKTYGPLWGERVQIWRWRGERAQIT